MITIGVDYGGPNMENSTINHYLTKTMRISKRERSENFDDGSSPWINPVYLVPGALFPIDFDGYKLGRFSRKQKGLVIMIAVPQLIVDGEGIEEFICESLREAVNLASKKFAGAGMSFSTLKAEKIIRKIETRL